MKSSFEIGNNSYIRTTYLTKEIIFSFICLIIFCSCINKRGNTKVLFERTEYDFGEIAADENISISFPFSNTGSAPLIIQDIKTSCGCTAPAFQEDKIMPNGESEIKVDIQPSSPGVFNSSVTVFYNGEKSPQILRIRGVVEYLSLLEE